MHYMVIYDVPSDTIRPKLADICMDYGLQRVQYSAFFGELETEHRAALWRKLTRRLGNAEGNIQMYPICERDVLQRLVMINLPEPGDEVQSSLREKSWFCRTASRMPFAAHAGKCHIQRSSIVATIMPLSGRSSSKWAGKF